MGSKERGADRGARLGLRDLIAVGEDVRAARIGAGLSLRTVGRAVGLSYSQVGRIERARHPNVSVVQLARICGVVGLDLRVRTYVAGPPLRDIAQVALLERLRERIHPDLRLDLEVPLPLEGDPRAWDAVISGHGELTAVEAVTRLHDLQAVLRRTSLKQRDAAIDRVLLLLADTARNRATMREADALIQDAFRSSARSALADLGAGRHPGGSSVVFL